MYRCTTYMIRDMRIVSPIYYCVVWQACSRWGNNIVCWKACVNGKHSTQGRMYWCGYIFISFSLKMVENLWIRTSFFTVCQIQNGCRLLATTCTARRNVLVTTCGAKTVIVLTTGSTVTMTTEPAVVKTFVIACSIVVQSVAALIRSSKRSD